MITVHLPLDLAQEFQTEPMMTLESRDMAEMLAMLDVRHPGMASWLSGSDGRIRQHLSIFVNGQRVNPEEGIPLTLPESSEVWILRAVSGG